MLEKSRLNPPRSRCSAPAVEAHCAGNWAGYWAGSACGADDLHTAGLHTGVVPEHLFVSAEDFDGVGILAGIDTCSSSYWWMPELYGPDGPDNAATSNIEAPKTGTLWAERQATRRLTGAAARKTAAA